MVFSTRIATCVSLVLAANACSLTGLGEKYGTPEPTPDSGAPDSGPEPNPDAGPDAEPECGVPLPSYIDRSLFLEAEDGVPLGPFIISDKTAAHGCKYIDMAKCDERAPMARFDFNVTAAGDYHIYVRTYTLDRNSDSFYVRVDGEPVNGFQFVMTNRGGFFEEQLMETLDDGNSTVVEKKVRLSQAEHAVEFLCREDDAGLDWIALVPAPAP